jgi:hypothetical protein
MEFQQKQNGPVAQSCIISHHNLFQGVSHMLLNFMWPCLSPDVTAVLYVTTQMEGCLIHIHQWSTEGGGLGRFNPPPA